MREVNRMNSIREGKGGTTDPGGEAMNEVLRSLGMSDVNPGGFAGTWVGSGKAQAVVSPIHGEKLATVSNVTPAEFEDVVAKCHKAWESWKLVPAPKRGEVVRALGDELRRNKEA